MDDSNTAPIYQDGVYVADLLLELAAHIDPKQVYVQRAYPARDLQFLSVVAEYKYLLVKKRGSSREALKTVLNLARHISAEFLQPNESSNESNTSLIPPVLQKQCSELVRKMKVSSLDPCVFDNATENLLRLLYTLPAPQLKENALRALKSSRQEFIGHSSQEEIRASVFLHSIKDQQIGRKQQELILETIIAAANSVNDLSEFAQICHSSATRLSEQDITSQRFEQYLDRFCETAQMMCEDPSDRGVWVWFQNSLMFLLRNRLRNLRNPDGILLLKSFVPQYVSAPEQTRSAQELDKSLEIFEIISELSLDATASSDGFHILDHEFPLEFLRFYTLVIRFKSEFKKSSQMQPLRALAESVFAEFFTYSGGKDLEFPFMLRSEMQSVLENSKYVEATFFDHALEFVLDRVCRLETPELKKSAIDELEISWEKIFVEDSGEIARDLLFLMVEEEPEIAHLLLRHGFHSVELQIGQLLESMLGYLDRFQALVNYIQGLDISIFGNMKFSLALVKSMLVLIKANIPDLRAETLSCWTQLLSVFSSVLLRSKRLGNRSTESSTTTSLPLEYLIKVDSKIFMLEDPAVSHSFSADTLAFIQAMNHLEEIDHSNLQASLSQIVEDYVSKEAKFPLQPDFVRESIQVDLWKSQTSGFRKAVSMRETEVILRRGLKRVYQTMGNLRPARMQESIRRVLWETWLQLMDCQEYRKLGEEIVSRMARKWPEETERLRQIEPELGLGDSVKDALNLLIIGMENLEMMMDAIFKVCRALKSCGFPVKVFGEISKVVRRLCGDILMKNADYMCDRQTMEQVALMESKWTEANMLVDLIVQFYYSCPVLVRTLRRTSDQADVLLSDAARGNGFKFGGSFKRISTMRISQPVLDKSAPFSAVGASAEDNETDQVADSCVIL